MKQSDYKQLLVEYRQTMSQLRGLRERVEKNPAMREQLWPTIQKVDQIKNDIHHRLKEMALRDGKPESEVNFDILLGDNSLDEYTLPEFTMTKVNAFLSKNKHAYLEVVTEAREEKQLAFPDGKGVERVPDKNPYDFAGNDPRLECAFIPFEQEISWHLYQNDPHYSKLPDSYERIRRAMCVAKEVGVLLGSITIPETFHEGAKWFGILFPVSRYEEVVDYMQRNREDISIRPEFFDNEQIKEDWKEIVVEDIQRIVAQESAVESIDYLLNRYRNDINRMPISEEQKAAAGGLIDREIAGREADKEIGGELVDRYSDLADLSSRESHRRRT